jgi:hypothetical protein
MSSLLRVRMKDTGKIVGLDPLRAAQVVQSGQGAFLDQGVKEIPTANGSIAVPLEDGEQGEVATLPEAETRVGHDGNDQTPKKRGGRRRAHKDAG